MKALRAISGNSAAAFEFLILAAARTSELIYAKWAEIAHVIERGDLLDKRRQLMEAWAEYCAGDQ